MPSASKVPITIPPSCDERKVLALGVADAVTKVYAVRKKYEAAKSTKAKNTGALYDSLLETREAERKTLHALREHIERHGCSV